MHRGSSAANEHSSVGTHLLPCAATNASACDAAGNVNGIGGGPLPWLVKSRPHTLYDSVVAPRGKDAGRGHPALPRTRGPPLLLHSGSRRRRQASEAHSNWRLEPPSTFGWSVDPQEAQMQWTMCSSQQCTHRILPSHGMTITVRAS